MRFARLQTLVLAGATGLVLAVGSMVSGPAPLDAAECGGPGDVLCKKNESCAWWLFFQQCTTEYDYYQEGADGPEATI